MICFSLYNRSMRASVPSHPISSHLSTYQQATCLVATQLRHGEENIETDFNPLFIANQHEYLSAGQCVGATLLIISCSFPDDTGEDAHSSQTSKAPRASSGSEVSETQKIPAERESLTQRRIKLQFPGTPITPSF
jgi:hypothetical protein